MTTYFIDMDGVLAKWNTRASIEDLYQKGYFKNLHPDFRVIQYVEKLLESGENVWIVSSYLTENEYALMEKEIWLDNYCRVPFFKRIFVPCGTSKAKGVERHIERSLTKDDMLIDDYNLNLFDWEEHGGTGIKYLNGINHKKGTWKGLLLDFGGAE